MRYKKFLNIIDYILHYSSHLDKKSFIFNSNYPGAAGKSDHKILILFSETKISNTFYFG